MAGSMPDLGDELNWFFNDPCGPNCGPRTHRLVTMLRDELEQLRAIAIETAEEALQATHKLQCARVFLTNDEKRLVGAYRRRVNASTELDRNRCQPNIDAYAKAMDDFDSAAYHLARMLHEHGRSAIGASNTDVSQLRDKATNA